MTRTAFFLTMVLSAAAVDAAAQDVAVLGPGEPTVGIAPIVVFDQSDSENVLGIAQASDLPDATIIQTGFYNRAAIVQSGLDPIATIDQLGTFNRALILQLNGDTDALILQGDAANTGIVLQTGFNNLSVVTQDGDQNAAFQFQDAGTVFALTPSDLVQVTENFLFAPETARAGVEFVNLDGIAFNDALIGRLARQSPAACDIVPLDIKSDPVQGVAGCDAFRFWGQVGYSGGDQADRTGVLGFDYETGSALAGAEMDITPYFTGGIALRYARGDGSVADGFADLDLDSYGGALYGDFQKEGLFLSGALSASYNDLSTSRDGSLASPGADVDGQTYGAVVEGGYLFDAGALQLGPVAGLSYARTDLDGYAEQGAFLLNQIVPDQDADTLLAMAGLRLAVARTIGASLLEAHADIAYERDVSNEDFEVLRTEFEFAPGVAILTPIEAMGDQDYLKLAGGVSLQLPSEAALAVSAGGRLFGEDRESFEVSASFTYPF